MNKTEREQQRQLWLARLCELEESEMTQEEWCNSKGIPYSTFRYWFRKLKKEAEDGSQKPCEFVFFRFIIYLWHNKFTTR